MARSKQLQLEFGPVRNSDLFTNHWLEHRLPLEPEWKERREAAIQSLKQLSSRWLEIKTILTRDLGEPTMEDEWVHPVLDQFGWKYVYQTFIKGRKPDYALFHNESDKHQAIKLGKREPEFWDKCIIVGDAKSWDTPLDRRSQTSEREFPPEQIEWYVQHTGVKWGLLTNGRLWRLSPHDLRRSQHRFETYLEVDLSLILDWWTSPKSRGRETLIINEFLRWYLLFSPEAYVETDDREPLIERALKGSTAYRIAVGGSLREQVFEALRLCIAGFIAHKPNKLDPEHDLEDCRQNAFTLLFRLLFIFFAEDRQFLPYRKNELYTRNRSLTRLHDELIQHLDMLKPTSVSIWSEWEALFAIIDEGKAAYGVPAYNGGLFDQSSHPFLMKLALPDTYAAKVLNKLRRATDPNHPDGEPVNVDYRDLAIQHLGNIYEGLLELKPRYAAQPMVEICGKHKGKTIEKTVPRTSPMERGFVTTGKTYDPGDVYLETDKGERRASGSYYTPDHIVQYIVEKTLGPICDEIDKALRREIEETEQAYERSRGRGRKALESKLIELKADYDDRVLRLTVVDPSMGSGHFLLRACQFFAEQIATNPHTSDPNEPDSGQGDEPTLLFWKRRVVERCLYGVDKNPIAVELAKLALWLETVSINQPLSFLDHHLRHGDSLVGAKLECMGRLHDLKVGVEALPGSIVEDRLPTLLKPLVEIRNMPSETVKQVKKKEELYRKTFEKVREPFRSAADLWVSVFFESDENQQVTPQQYHEVIMRLNTLPRFKLLKNEPWFERARACASAPGIDAFHWELEFPEVFLAPERVREDRSGFDAIIGNPPYDVLSDKELGRDLTALKRFIAAMLMYDPSRRGKNNLYKLFICRSLDMLADRGRLGFIVPMTLLGDDQAADIRRAISRVGSFTGVESFPQKDNPAKRVFLEAKLSTSVFTMIKTTEASDTQFVVRSHAGNTIEAESPSLVLSAKELPLYDPNNYSIVSCTQDDWTLAVRLMSSGRMSRLGETVKFSQGEVNETVQRAAHCLEDDVSDGKVVQRGANISLYVLRPASQGKEIVLNDHKFLDGKASDTKAYHYLYARIGLQESCPQNNFRRLIASFIPKGEYCNHKINYVIEPDSDLRLEVLLALLNSKLSDWYFRLGSTNAAVSHYQLHNLPCPVFGNSRSTTDTYVVHAVQDELRVGNCNGAFERLRAVITEPPFSKAVQDVLVDIVNRIIRAEKARGKISRSERSKLSDDAQPFQDLIDRIIYTMAGLSEEEAGELEARLAKML